jgi:hypothetical protein
MPASQAGRRRFDPGRPLHDSGNKFEGLGDSPERVTGEGYLPSPTYHPFLAVDDPPLASTESARYLNYTSGFGELASRLYEVAHAVYCEELCSQVHADCGGCEHQSHTCGCPHSELYDFDWEPSAAESERWSQSATTSLLAFIAKLDCSTFSADEIEARLEWWWRGENRALRKAMESSHRKRCERGRGVLINRVTGEQIPNRCKSWRDCSYCAWLYGASVEPI